MSENPPAGTPAGPPKAPAPRPTCLMWQGKPLPCFVKAVVYGAGQAAALGIKTTNPALLRECIQEEDQVQQMRTLLSQQVRDELARQNITYGLKEDEIVQTIEAFLEAIVLGTGNMASRKIAEGELPASGEDGFLEYVRNPQGVALKLQGREAQRLAARQLYQAKKGEALVVRHPPVAGKDGVSVRGEKIEPARQPRDVSLPAISGPNTEVQAQKLVAAIDGVYREDLDGRVWVVQELAVDQVAPATGDLPRSGVAAVNVLVRQTIAGSASVLTTEDVFVGTPQEPGIVEASVRVRARNLLVRGQVAGGQLPASYLSGELESLESVAQRRIRSQLERSQIEVGEIFGAREVLGRNIIAGRALVQSHVYGAALEVREDVLVDGNLSGGLVVCGTRLQVMGDLGNSTGTTTRIHLGTDDMETQKADRIRVKLQAEREKLEGRVQELETHQSNMEKKSAKSAYWAAFMQGEKRVPQRPLEKQLLVQFLEAAKEKKRLEQEVADAQRQVRDLARLLQEAGQEEGADEAGLQVVVGGTIFPGVCLELVRKLEAEDLERKVKDRTGKETTIGALKTELSQPLNNYLELYQESLEERQKALEQMFKGMENRPQPPRIPDRRFQMELIFPEEERAGIDLALEGAVYAHAHDPANFYLKLTGKVRDPLRQAVISIEKSDGGMVFKCAPAAGAPTPWQRDERVLEALEAVQVLGRSGRAHLLG